MKRALVLGAGGALGLGLCRYLSSQGWKVRAFSRTWYPDNLLSLSTETNIEVIEGSIFDAEALHKALDGISHVFNFVSFSIPSTSPSFPEIEIDQTLRGLNVVLTEMVRAGVKRIIYPSSGGTIYGETNCIPAAEDFPLLAQSSYGVGKILSEEVIRFYSRVHGIQYKILRISNIYGYLVSRGVSQGVVDIFINKLRKGENIQIWGPLNTVRDYLYIEDLFQSISVLIESTGSKNITVNIGSGNGSTLENIIELLKNITGIKLAVEVNAGHYSGINYNVLNCSLMESLTGWRSQHTLKSGIEKLWNREAIVSHETQERK